MYVGEHESTSYWGTRLCDHEVSLDLQHRTLNSLQPWQSFWFGAPIQRCSGILPPLCFRGVIPDSAAPHPQPSESCLTLSLNCFPRNQIPAPISNVPKLKNDHLCAEGCRPWTPSSTDVSPDLRVA